MSRLSRHNLEIMTKQYSIYLYQCPKTFEFFYVGKDCGNGHRGNDWHPPHSRGPVDSKLAKLQRWGLKPIIHRLLEFDSCENADDLLKQAEVYWIAEGYRRGWPLMNCTEGGGGRSAPHSEETKAKMRQHIFSAQHKENLSKAAKGKRKSEGHKRNIGMAQKGRKQTAEVVEKRMQSMAHIFASDKWRKDIGDRMRGNSYALGRVQSKEEKEQRRKSSNKRAIIDQNGTRYESIREASRLLDLSSGTIVNVLKGRISSIRGYTFSYEGETSEKSTG